MAVRGRGIRTQWVWLGALGVAAAVVALASPPAPPSRATFAPELVRQDAPRVRFGRDVRPILVKNCLVCHGFDPSTRKAGLRLDTFEEATRTRSADHPAAIVPGDPDRSLLLARVSAHDPVDRMPPEGEALTPDQIRVLRTWIEQGAAYERHWSLRPVEYHAPPDLVDAAWGEGAIDRFIGARLAEAGLEPAPRADRRVLIRRLSFDLTGLPPAPEDVDAFLADDSPDAWPRLVDRLLASPRFGERWARHWLDLMRYAETYAHEYDYPIRNAWRYRDYVIRAFNADVPYDQFVTEHIAGDLLDHPRLNPAQGYNESILATGFWWLSQGTHAPVDVRQDEADRIDNQIDVVSKAFLATTVSCARCHDHKFDPILTREYYGLAGFVQSSRRQDAYLDPGDHIAQSAQSVRSLQDQISRRVRDVAALGLRERAQGIEALLVSTAAAMYAPPPDGEAPDGTPDEVVDRFDDGSYDRWTVEGDAFTPTPTPTGDAPLSGEGTARGAGFANSHRREPDGDSVKTDERVGRLIGPEFTIEHRYLHFLIGGGDNPGGTGLRVVADGRTIGEATGHNSLRLRPERIDLGTSLGRRARIELFDTETGGWGNIRVDDLVLSDRPVLDVRPTRSIAAVATERGVDEATLRAWVEGAGDLSRRPEDNPIGSFLAGAGVVSGAPDAPIPDWTRAGADPDQRETIEDFERPDALGDWFETGWAFDARTAGAARWRALAGGPRLAERASADSGLLWSRFMGTLRSPTFEITSPFVAVRARGRGVVRLIVDGYTMDEYNALLFERVRLEVDSAHWAWYVHDLRLHEGHRAHYEIIDDDPDASIAVDQIVFMDRDHPPGGTAWRDVLVDRLGERPTLGAVANEIANAVRRALSGEADEVGAAAANALMDLGLLRIDDEEIGALRARLAAAGDSAPTPLRAMAMEDGPGENERVFIRGSHTSLGEEAPRGFLSALCDDPRMDIPEGSGRLRLAERILDDSNPLPARVMVNRVWHHLFGRGIVETTDDFGLQGQSPTHPELLDHLAFRFRGEMGWSVKALIREIVLSEAYRRSAGALDERASRVDPRNHLLSVRRPRRLDGESVRDAMLRASGRLDLTMEGPSVPTALTPFMTGRGRPGRTGPLDGDGRRSIYLEVRRNFPMPMMATFDTPNPHSTIGARSESNVPAQSLILLNDPFVVRQATLLADRVAREDAGSDAGPDMGPVAGLDRLYRLTLGRLPEARERAAAAEFIARQQAEHRRSGAGEEDSRRRAWADLAHVVFNLKEFVFLE